MMRGHDRVSVLQLVVEQPKPGWAEIDPEKLWTQFQMVVKQSIASKLVSWRVEYVLG